MSIIHIHLFRQCGVHDPSWTEMRHFIWFLDTQIKSSEHSIFCNESVVGDVMSGFKTFVVKFMIRMSKVTCFVSAKFWSIVLFETQFFMCTTTICY